MDHRFALQHSHRAALKPLWHRQPNHRCLCAVPCHAVPRRPCRAVPCCACARAHPCVQTHMALTAVHSRHVQPPIPDTRADVRTHARTHARMHARTHARTHTCTRAHVWQFAQRCVPVAGGTRCTPTAKALAVDYGCRACMSRHMSVRMSRHTAMHMSMHMSMHISCLHECPHICLYM